MLGTAPLNVSARRLEARAREFSRPGRPALPAFELIATLAQSAPGDDGMHRLRQTDAVIARHLRAVRAAKGLLVLDIQPGQADFLDEVKALEKWLVQPDVSLALDPEWSVPAGVQPGSVIGSTDAATVNEVADYLARHRAGAQPAPEGADRAPVHRGHGQRPQPHARPPGGGADLEHGRLRHAPS